jgi:voltage-gated potassium channel
MFRILKLMRFHLEANALRTALAASIPKISVFLGTVLATVVIVGAAMYMIEGPEHGFDDIPRSMYWAVVTLTTVGYGDIAPQTPVGQFLASLVMLMGYAIIAVPTGIVTAEMSRLAQGQITTKACEHCSAEGHQYDAKFCRRCGETL